jgi:ATP-dependent exoDNAse (exonuclease V) alpha subunit
MLPIVLAFAITVHKSQGLTLDKAVLDLSEKDFVAGLSYVGVSRMKTLNGIMFRTDFEMSRFQGQPSATKRMRNLDRERRALQAVNVL